MAVVYLANDPRLARRVAIKVMLPGLAMNEGMIERFELEARNAAQLEHEHIVTIYSVEDAEDLAYFVMKYVDGVSLGDILRVNGALPIAPLREALAQVANALDFAHRSKVVHRDVKPGNVMVDVRGHAVVTDFGISKGGSTNQQLTEVGAVVGTPPYMSPEQWRGDAASPASDQYALGVMMYELLTGGLPFRGNTMELSRQHLFEPPPSIAERRSDCPSDVVALLDRLLAKNPAERFSTLEEVQLVLEAPPGLERRRAREELAALVASTRASSEAPEAVPLPPTPEAGGGDRPSASPIGVGKAEGVTPTRILVKYDREAEKTALQGSIQATSQQHRDENRSVSLESVVPKDAVVDVTVAGGNDRAVDGVVQPSASQAAASDLPATVEPTIVGRAEIVDTSLSGQHTTSGPSIAPAQSESVRQVPAAPPPATPPDLTPVASSVRGTKALPQNRLVDVTSTNASSSGGRRRGLVVAAVLAIAAAGAWFAMHPRNRTGSNAPDADTRSAASAAGGASNTTTAISSSDSRPIPVAPTVDSTSVAPALGAGADSTGIARDSVNTAVNATVNTTATAAVPPGEPPATPPKPIAPPAPTALAVAASVTVSGLPNDAMSVGERVRLRAQAKTAAGARMPNATYSWRVEPSGIARVSARGELEALAPGTATIVVSSGKATARQEVTIIAATLASLKLFVRSPLHIGDTATFYVRATDQRGHPFPASDVTWNSSNDRVLSVDAVGVATARKKGGAKVRASLGALSTTLEVKVEDRATAFDAKAEERGGTSGGSRATIPGSGTTPASPGANEIPSFSEASVRDQLQACLTALRKRDTERVRVLAGTPVTGEASPLEQLLAVMRPKEAKFQLLNTDLSRPTRVAGSRATLDFRVRVGWINNAGKDAESWLDYRALFEPKDGAWRMSWCAPRGSANLTR